MISESGVRLVRVECVTGQGGEGGVKLVRMEYVIGEG